jgi:hypothetical protein
VEGQHLGDEQLQGRQGTGIRRKREVAQLGEDLPHLVGRADSRPEGFIVKARLGAFLEHRAHPLELGADESDLGRGGNEPPG